MRSLKRAVNRDNCTFKLFTKMSDETKTIMKRSFKQ